MTYGLPRKPGYQYTRPFDFFYLEVTAVPDASRTANSLENATIRGLLKGEKYEAGDDYRRPAGGAHAADRISGKPPGRRPGRGGEATVAPRGARQGQRGAASAEPSPVTRASAAPERRHDGSRSGRRLDRLPLRRAPRDRSGPREARGVLPLSRARCSVAHGIGHLVARVDFPDDVIDRDRDHCGLCARARRVRRLARLPTHRAHLLRAHRADRSGHGRRRATGDLGPSPPRGA
jgi:hypothetical protein